MALNASVNVGFSYILDVTKGHSQVGTYDSVAI